MYCFMARYMSDVLRFLRACGTGGSLLSLCAGFSEQVSEDELISRSKVVLNMHYFEPGQLGSIRIFDLLANGVAVVSELNADQQINPDLKDAIVAAPYRPTYRRSGIARSHHW